MRFWTIRGRRTVGFGMRMIYAKLQGWAEQNLLKVSLKTVVLQLGLGRINNLLKVMAEPGFEPRDFQF